MSFFHSLYTIQAEPMQVYEALTTPEGLAQWWTKDCEVGDRVGDRSKFHFGEGYVVMCITGLIPYREVRWDCIDQYRFAEDDAFRAGEWVGTNLRFQMTDHYDGGTDIHFEHRGLTPDLGCYKACESGWNHYLGVSLKQFLETGVGEPYVAKQHG